MGRALTLSEMAMYILENTNLEKQMAMGSTDGQTAVPILVHLSRE